MTVPLPFLPVRCVCPTVKCLPDCAQAKSKAPADLGEEIAGVGSHDSRKRLLRGTLRGGWLLVSHTPYKTSVPPAHREGWRACGLSSPAAQLLHCTAVLRVAALQPSSTSPNPMPHRSYTPVPCSVLVCTSDVTRLSCVLCPVTLVCLLCLTLTLVCLLCLLCLTLTRRPQTGKTQQGT